MALKLLRKRSKLLFVYLSLLTVGVILFVYFLGSSSSQNYFKASLEEEDKLYLRGLLRNKGRYPNGEDRMTSLPPEKRQQLEFRLLQEYPENSEVKLSPLASQDEASQDGLVDEEYDQRDAINIPRFAIPNQDISPQLTAAEKVDNHTLTLYHHTMNGAIETNYTLTKASITKNLTERKYNDKFASLTFHRNQLLRQIKFAPVNPDSFSQEEDALFTKPAFASPWMAQFKPPAILYANDSNICEDSSPFLLALILSRPRNRLARKTIRETWGSAARTQRWPHQQLNARVKLLFVIGIDNIYPSVETLVLFEKKHFNDILMLNMTEDYNRLTMKILAALRWVNETCSDVRFVLKVDEDSFINLPLLVDYLLLNEKKLSKSVFGNMYGSPKVWRSGKWKLSYPEYPFARFPSHSSGSTYIISGDAVPILLNMSKYFVPISIEDAYITGILAKAAGVNRFNTTAMAMLGDLQLGREFPKMCEFHTKRFALTNCTVEMHDRIWLAVLVNYCGIKGHMGMEDMKEE